MTLLPARVRTKIVDEMDRAAILGCALLFALACGNGEEDPASVRATAQVTGTIAYRERVLLKPDSVVEVRLLDTSKADAPAVELAHQRITEPGRPPVPFALAYDPDEIEERRSYSVRATISRGDQMLFTTDRDYPVLTRGAGNTADLILGRVDSGVSAPETAE